MADLFDEPGPGANAPEFTVSEIFGAVKKTLEGQFPHLRVRGEVSRVSRPSSGHIYFELKDERAVLPAAIWAGVARGLAYLPAEGDEVVATGKISAFGGKYQLLVEAIAPAGIGALMAMLERRRRALAAEGLFDAGRKKALPYLPQVIGVITSPSGAVIRDILHRLGERCPVHVLIWPVTVQGEKCAPEVAAAIRGFNAIAPGGPVPRPDLLIVARGGGSVEDLWGFNEESVVRAAAASAIPLIAAIGHETDTTLIDLAADLRAPTPSAAAELAVPVRAELAARLADLGARSAQGLSNVLGRARERLRDRSRALPRAEALLADPRQRLDALRLRLPAALGALAGRHRLIFERAAARLSPQGLREGLARRRAEAAARAERLAPALSAQLRRLQPMPQALAARLERAMAGRVSALRLRLEGLARAHAAFDADLVLKRGYALVLARGAAVTSAGKAAAEARLTLRFQDGEIEVIPGPAA